MSGEVRDLGGVAVFACAADGPPLGSERDAVDLLGEALGTEARLLLIPAERLSADFLRLRTGVAGAVLQKFVNYGFRTAIMGDISGAVAGSEALRDFVGESNRGHLVWFVDDLAELERRLAAASA